MDRIHLSRQTTGELTVLPAAGGVWQVWERPRVHCRYVLSVRGGGKPKLIGGRKERERSVVLVLRKWFATEGTEEVTPTRLVCRLTPPTVLDLTPLAELVALVADWYGGALTFVEVKDGALLAKECQRVGVAVQVQERLDLATSRFTPDLGWLTDGETGPAALNALVNAIRATGQWTAKGKDEGGRMKDEVNEHAKMALVLECPHALAEIETFAGDSEAPAVSHDDDVRALATGLYNIDAATRLNAEARRKVGPRDGWKAGVLRS
jgi:hypothetical protein